MRLTTIGCRASPSAPESARGCGTRGFSQVHILNGNPETCHRLGVSTPGRVFEWTAVNSFSTVAKFLKTLAFLAALCAAAFWQRACKGYCHCYVPLPTNQPSTN